IGQRYLYVYPGTAATVFKGGETVAKARSVVDVGELFNRLGPIIKAIDPQQVNTFLDAIVQALEIGRASCRERVYVSVAAEDGIRDDLVTGVQTCALPIFIGQRYLYVYPGTAATVFKGGETVAKARSVVDVGELFNRLGPIIKAIDPQQVNTFLDAIVQAL